MDDGPPPSYEEATKFETNRIEDVPISVSILPTSAQEITTEERNYYGPINHRPMHYYSPFEDITWCYFFKGICLTLVVVVMIFAQIVAPSISYPYALDRMVPNNNNTACQYGNYDDTNNICTCYKFYLGGNCSYKQKDAWFAASLQFGYFSGFVGGGFWYLWRVDWAVGSVGILAFFLMIGVCLTDSNRGNGVIMTIGISSLLLGFTIQFILFPILLVCGVFLDGNGMPLVI